MENIWSLVIMCGIVWFLWTFFEGRLKMRKESGEQAESLPYVKKQYFLTNNEHGFLNTLERIVENKYYIFPQVHYSKIMYARGQQNFKNPDFNRIDRKSADFVLFDKQKVSPVLVIEVDDSSHNRSDRMKRDYFINHVLEKCEIPIVRISPFVGEEEFRKQIMGKIAL